MIDSDENDPYDYDYDYQPYGGGDYHNVEEEEKENMKTKEESIKLRELELAKKQAELEEMEYNLKRKSQTMNAPVYVDGEGGVNADIEYVENRKNWPICYPIVDHSYRDIPSKTRKLIAWIGYILFYHFAALMIINMITSWIILFAPQGSAGMQLYNKIKFVVIAAILAAFTVPANFALVYWPLYKAMKYATIPRFIISFITIILHLIISIFAIAGWGEYGFGGLVTLILYFPTDTESYIGFVPNFILIILWATQIIGYIFIFIASIIIFRKRRLRLKDMGAYAKDTMQTIPGVFASAVTRKEETQQTTVDPEDIDAFYNDSD